MWTAVGGLALTVLTVCWPGPAPAVSAEPVGSSPSPSATYVPAVGGTLTVGIDRAPTGCNPNTATGDTSADRLLLEPVLPSTFFVSDTGNAHYDSAVIEQAELQGTSPETVVYTINPRAVWSDGVPITAADFKYAWEQQRSATLLDGSPADVASTAGYDDIKSITGSNHGRTVTVVFTTPFADWQSLFNYLLPAHVLEHTGWSPPCSTLDPAVDLSGGPYEIASVAPNRIVLVRNPRWWGQPLSLDRIVVRVADNESELASWLKSGEIQVADPSAFDPTFLQAVAGMPFVTVQANISSRFLQLEFSVTSPVTSDLDVRLGIAHAIDRQALLNAVVGWANIQIVPSNSHLYLQTQSAYPTTPTFLPANQTTTTTVPSTTGAPFPSGADLQDSSRELAAAGFHVAANGTWVDGQGEPLSVRLVLDSGDSWDLRAGALIARQLRRAGISVTVSEAPTATAAGQQLASGAADLALIPTVAGPYMSETSTWFSPMAGAPGQGGSEDWSNYDSAKVDALFQQAMQELDPVAAEPLYAQIDQLLWTNMVSLPLFAEPSVLAWSDFTSGISPNPFPGGLFWQVTTWALQVKEPVGFKGTPHVGRYTTPGSAQ